MLKLRELKKLKLYRLEKALFDSTSSDRDLNNLHVYKKRDCKSLFRIKVIIQKQANKIKIFDKNTLFMQIH